jgi:hypothetical protein
LALARTIARNNGCADPDQAAPFPENGSLLHVCTSFEGCDPGLPVRFCAFDQNHKAAPYDGDCAECDSGEEIPQEIWDFYTQF